MKVSSNKGKIKLWKCPNCGHMVLVQDIERDGLETSYSRRL